MRRASSACWSRRRFVRSRCGPGSSTQPKWVSARQPAPRRPTRSIERIHAATSMSGGGVGGRRSPRAESARPRRRPRRRCRRSVEVDDVVGGVARRVLDVDSRPRRRSSRLPRARAGSASGTGSDPPQRAHRSPYRRSALRRSFSGSIRCGAPRECTHTSSSGNRSTSAPVAPAWSRWMWVSSSARGCPESPRAASHAALGPRIDHRSAQVPGADHAPVPALEHVDQARIGNCHGAKTKLTS